MQSTQAKHRFVIGDFEYDYRLVLSISIEAALNNVAN